MTLLPKKIHIDALHNDEEGFATAATEFVKAYTCLQIAIASCETFYDVFKHHHLDMGEVKKSYNTLMADMDHLANYLNTHFGFDTKKLLGKVYDEAQQEIDNELNSDNGHYVDDPLLITSVVPEFQNIGDLKPIHNEERTNTSYQ